MNAHETVYGRENAKVEIELVDHGESWEFAVTDNGSPYSDEEVHRIFDPFYRSERYGSSSRLALVLAKKIANAHGGMLQLKTASGNRFGVTIPKRQAGSAKAA
jgi:signal transduction histidine kinase